MNATVVSLDRVREQRNGTEPWLTKQQIAKHLGYSTRWVELRVREQPHGLPCKRWGNRLRFQRSAVEAWLDERESA